MFNTTTTTSGYQSIFLEGMKFFLYNLGPSQLNVARRSDAQLGLIDFEAIFNGHGFSF
jgi:hypothetical protein